MALINDHFLKLTNNYLYSDIGKKVNAFKTLHPKSEVLNLGVGDVTRPLPAAVVEAMHRAVDEMGTERGFRGYSPEQGYDFLREAIIRNDFLPRGVKFDLFEIFVNDGAKSDTGNIQELVRWDNSVAVADPNYPVYIEANIMIGRAGVNEGGRWSSIIYMPCDERNGFIPSPPDHRVDIVYLCYPNNPTGAAITKEELKRWVDYALKNDVLIFYDATYESYIQGDDLPHSIYEIRGAKKVAIEFHSYSKTAGFTGVRCGYTVVPKELTASALDGTRYELNPLWQRRQSTKFNGTSYISQRAAEAVYSPEGRQQTQEIIRYYMDNARLMHDALTAKGMTVYGGVHAPYLWVRTPNGETSWRFFEQMLYNAQVVCTPGVGFGPGGEGYVRLSSFSKREICEEATERICKWI